MTASEASVWRTAAANSSLMVGIVLLSLLVNAYSIVLLAKHRREEVHLRASWIFLSNDVIANVGVIVAGLLVSGLNSRLPDLMIGFVIAIVILRGSISIIRDAKHYPNPRRKTRAEQAAQGMSYSIDRICAFASF